MQMRPSVTSSPSTAATSSGMSSAASLMTGLMKPDQSCASAGTGQSITHHYPQPNNFTLILDEGSRLSGIQDMFHATACRWTLALRGDAVTRPDDYGPELTRQHEVVFMSSGPASPPRCIPSTAASGPRR